MIQTKRKSKRLDKILSNPVLPSLTEIDHGVRTVLHTDDMN